MVFYAEKNTTTPRRLEKSRFCDMGRISKMIESAKYVKIVEWSDEDECFIGYCPGIIGPCCHGTDEIEVYRQLCEIVDEWIEILHRDNETLPSPTIGKNIEEFLNGMGNN